MWMENSGVYVTVQEGARCNQACDAASVYSYDIHTVSFCQAGFLASAWLLQDTPSKRKAAAHLYTQPLLTEWALTTRMSPGCAGSPLPSFTATGPLK